MRTEIVCALLGAVLGWTAPAHAIDIQRPSGEREESWDDDREAELFRVQPPAPFVERRWVGLREEGLTPCPSVPGWHAGSLLDGLPRPDHPGLRRLARICVYTADGPAPPPFRRPPGLLRAERDRMAVAPFGPPGEACPPAGALGQNIAPALEHHFLRQVGQVQLDPALPPGVRLVFIDTQPTGEWPLLQPGRSCHGFTMAHLARRLVCGDGPCPIDFATRLALRYPDYRPDIAVPPPGAAGNEGGHLGLVLDLAHAILAEVQHWEQNGTGQKLVLNLSVGWDGEVPGAGALTAVETWRESQLEPSMLAVYDALRYAARRGVLVIAAAGNRRGGPAQTRWPVLPAAWELRRPPCPLFAWGRKPVYAVGGVDWQRLPLPNARHGGLPRRVAYADHAIAGTAATPTSLYTGSSVSAAVTSATAAAVWTLRPKLGRAGVMRLVSRSGDRLSSRADFYAWKPLAPLVKPPRLRRVSLCRSVLAACGPDGRRCAALVSVSCQLGQDRAASFRDLPVPSAPPHPSPPAHASPMDMLPDLRTPGWVGPQPPNDPCPTCVLIPDQPSATSTDTQDFALLAEIDSKWHAAFGGRSINSAVLTVHCLTDGTHQQVKIDISGPFPSAPSTPAKLSLGPLGGLSTLTGCRASVDFGVSGAPARSVQSAVYVDP